MAPFWIFRIIIAFLPLTIILNTLEIYSKCTAWDSYLFQPGLTGSLVSLHEATAYAMNDIESSYSRLQQMKSFLMTMFDRLKSSAGLFEEILEAVSFPHQFKRSVSSFADRRSQWFGDSHQEFQSGIVYWNATAQRPARRHQWYEKVSFQRVQ